MDQSISILHPTACAICGTEGNATELYPANFDASTFNKAVFSARRLPDGAHYRLVKCNTCGLVRSDPVVDREILSRLYQASTFTYQEQVPDLQFTYGKYLAKLEKLGVNKTALLEIGCGNGFFLEVALAQGYASVRGVEPSAQAVSQASEQLRPFIVCDVIRPGLFVPASFNVICIFQVFDHISDPGSLLDECFRLLKPGGFLLAYNHNVEALSARLLGERSPIIDIEHTYLYSPRTMSRLVEKHHFSVTEVGSGVNRYRLSYLTHLMPLPRSVKTTAISLVQTSPFGRIPLSVFLGNLYLIAQKD